MEKEYFLGLDIGTNSVGYAVTDEEYNLIKHKGEPMWGVHIFDEGKQSAERRSFRTARRRLDRRQQRVHLVQEIFCKEISQIDDKFFIRLQERALFQEDTSTGSNSIFPKDGDFSDKEYYKKYPTIHHLILELMTDSTPHDVRLVYMAIAWLVAHRGHFLSEVGKDNIDSVLDFNSVYQRFIDCFTANGIELPWEADSSVVMELMLLKMGVTNKKKAFKEKLWGGKAPKPGEDTIINAECIANLLAGGTEDASKLFPQLELEEKVSICLRKDEDTLAAAFAAVDDETGILAAMKDLFDWSLLNDVLNGCESISESMVKKYDQHKIDLTALKQFVKKYFTKEKYNTIFRAAGNDNYVAYSYNIKNCDEPQSVKKITKDKFYDFLKKQLKVQDESILEENDLAFYKDMMERIDMLCFLPKQVDGDNRVIPYQLYYHELKKLLEKAESYLPFLSEADSDGFSNIQKLLDIFTFRIPYFVGPLHSTDSNIAWIKRKASGRILPWNLEDKVDLMASEEAFIERMTNTCTYVPGEPVLPKGSLVYAKYTVLNEINNIKVNGASISVAAKQKVFELFKNYKKVSRKRIEECLRANNWLNGDDVLEGIDININSSLRPYHDFKRLLESNTLTETQVEEIISRLTYSEDKNRIRIWLEEHYGFLNADDRKYIAGLKYSDFGRLSGKLLNGIRAPYKTTGEAFTIIEAMWEHNINLMQLLFSDEYGFKETLEEIRNEYYADHPVTMNSIMDDMYVSNAVKRPIFRTLAVVKDVVKATGKAPKRIFVEMARGADEKPQRTKTRRDTILELYKNFDKQEVRELSALLEGKSDNELQSEVLFLYFMQMGKCMYSGTPLDIEKLKTADYNVDHIYPQAYVKDDSLNNKALVLSSLNGEKGDVYPIKKDIRDKMHGFWKMLNSNGLVSDEKFKRLTRGTPFTEEEKLGFINRQLVETRQSTKVVTTILQNKYPETEIIYVKAGLASSFKQEYKITKSRLINDLHHAKDAYLNIVCGNVYHSKFTVKRGFTVNQKYSIKTTAVYGHEVKLGGQVIWKGQEDIGRIKNVVSKSHIHYTKYQFARKGGFFDQQPVKASENLVPRKAGLSSEKYGGYNKPSASFFLLTAFTEAGKKPKKDAMFMPVELLAGDAILKNETTAIEYAKRNLAAIWGKDEATFSDIYFPLGLRPLKVNTMLDIDGFRACISGKANGGAIVMVSSATPLIVDMEFEAYIKKLETFSEKKSKNSKIVLNQEYDGITCEKNNSLYELLSNKLSNRPFNVIYGNQGEILRNSFDKFNGLSLDNQVSLLLNVVDYMKTGHSGGCNLKLIGGVEKSGVPALSSKLSNLSKKWTSIRILDMSVAGYKCKVSNNLLEIL